MVVADEAVAVVSAAELVVVLELAAASAVAVAVAQCMAPLDRAAMVVARVVAVALEAVRRMAPVEQVAMLVAVQRIAKDRLGLVPAVSLQEDPEQLVLVLVQTGILRAEQGLELVPELALQDWVVTVSQLPTRANSIVFLACHRIRGCTPTVQQDSVVAGPVMVLAALGARVSVLAVMWALVAAELVMVLAASGARVSVLAVM